MIIVNGFKPLTIITKRSILDVAAALDPPLTLWGYTVEASEGNMELLGSMIAVLSLIKELLQ